MDQFDPERFQPPPGFVSPSFFNGLIAAGTLSLAIILACTFIAIQLAGCSSTWNANVTGSTTKENPSVKTESSSTDNGGLNPAEKPD